MFKLSQDTSTATEL